MAISAELHHKIVERTQMLSTSVVGLREAETLINDLTASFPVTYSDKTDFETLTLQTAAAKHLSNRSRKSALMIAKIAREQFDALVGEASLDGVYEHFEAYQITRKSVTDAMKMRYALSHPVITELQAVVAEAESLAEFFKTETSCLETTEVEFRNFAKAINGY